MVMQNKKNKILNIRWKKILFDMWFSFKIIFLVWFGLLVFEIILFTNNNKSAVLSNILNIKDFSKWKICFRWQFWKERIHSFNYCLCVKIIFVSQIFQIKIIKMICDQMISIHPSWTKNVVVVIDRPYTKTFDCFWFVNLK